MTKKTNHKHKSKSTHKSADGSHHAKSAHKTHKTSHADDEAWYTKPTTWVIAILVIAVAVLLLRDTGTGSGSSTETQFAGDGTVVVQDYSYFLCTHCRTLAPIISDLNDKYASNDAVTFEFKHFPLGDQGKLAHEASECARDQGAFMEYKNLVFANFGEVSQSDLISYAEQLGLDTDTFTTCLTSGEKSSIVEADFAEGQSMNVRGTPTIFINGVLYEGARSVSALSDAIDGALDGGDSTGSSAGTSTGSTTDPANVDTSNDPEFEMIVLNDQDCSVCDSSQIVSVTQTQIFPTAQVREVDVSSAEGQAMLEEYSVTALPAYFFAEPVTQAANFEQLQSNGLVTQNNDLYQITAAASQANYYTTQPVISDNDHVYGNIDAPITVVEYSDFLCSYCGAASGLSSSGVSMMQGQDPSWEPPIVGLKELADAGEIRFVYKHYLRTESSVVPITASECAADQGMFWEYHDVLFANQGEVMSGLSNAEYAQYASDLGMDEDAFLACMETKDVSDITSAALTEAQSFGISGTPGFMVNNYKLSGAVSFSEFESLLAEITAE